MGRFGIMIDNTGGGPGGLLPPGTEGQTLRWSDVAGGWVANSFLWNNETNVGVGGKDSGFFALMDVRGATNDNTASAVYIQNLSDTASFQWRNDGAVLRNKVLFSIPYHASNTTWGSNAGSSLIGAGGATNTLIGGSAGMLITTGADNTIMGNNAGVALTTTVKNVFIGNGAGFNTTGEKNTYVGSTAGRDQIAGKFNVAIGTDAGRNTLSLQAASTSNANIFLGTDAGDGNTTGSFNIFIGLSQGFNALTSERCIVIGQAVIATSYGAGDIASFSAPRTDVLGFGTRVQFTKNNQIVFGTNSSTYYYEDMQIKWTATNTHGVYFRIATPEAAQAAEQGSIAYVNTGSAGNAYVKYSGTGNTGWGRLVYEDSSGFTVVTNLQITSLAGAGEEVLIVANDGTIGASTFSTKGSILVYDGVDVTVLAAGTNGQALVADSTAPTGLKYADIFALPAGSTGETLRYSGTNTVASSSFLYNSGSAIGVGLTSPASLLHIDGGTGTATYLQITAGSTTGQASTDGFHIGIDSTGIAEIRQRENLSIKFYTNNAVRFTMDANGRSATNSTGNVIYRTTNGGSNENAHFLIDPAGSVSAGNAIGFDSTNGQVFTAANATRRIAVAGINITAITTTAGSETATLSLYAKPAGGAMVAYLNIIGDARVVVLAARHQTAKGANVTAANDLTLGSDGNTFTITGNTQINAITTANWQAGSRIILIFTGTPTVKHNTAGGAGTAVMLLSGSADFAAANNSVLDLVYDGTVWQQVSRKAA